MSDNAKTPIGTAFQALRDFARCKLKGRILYHYTTLPTLAEFCKDDGKLYCTHFAALNDSSELSFGIGLICEQLEAKFGVPHGLCEQFKRCFDKGCSTGQIPPTWIMSFSLEQDSLYQWGMYTDRQQGGYSVGFDENKLKQLVYDYNDKCICPFSLYLFPCMYGKTNKNEIDLFLKALFGNNKDLQTIKSCSSGNKNAVAHIFARTVLASCVIKHESFAYENEVRLIVPPIHSNFGDAAFIGGKPRWNTSLFPNEDGQLRSLIKEIWVSPHGARQLLKATAEVLVRKYVLKTAIKESASPYNGR